MISDKDMYWGQRSPGPSRNGIYHEGSAVYFFLEWQSSLNREIAKSVDLQTIKVRITE